MNLHISPQRATDELLARPNLRLRVGEQIVDVGALRVATRPELPRLTGKAVAVLIELVRHAGSTVTRDQLLERVWTGRFTTPDVLNQAITELRRALADDSRPPRYIETIPRVGYRLIARVQLLEPDEGALFIDSAEPSINDDIAPATAVRERAPARSRRRTTLLVVLLAIAVVAAALLVPAARNRLAPAAGTAGAPATAAHPWRVSEARALTSDPGAERRPHISADGSRIAFGLLDTSTGFDRIVVRTLEPSQLVHLTPGRNEHEALPVWSPDGARIAYERLHGAGCTMHVASSLGGSEREIGRCRRYFSNYYDWTPDGRALVSAGRADDEQDGFRLMRLDLESGSRTFFDYQRDALDQDIEPRYSPDGRTIAFRRGFAPYSDLFVMDASGGAVHQLTHLATRIRGYAWTRDGRALVFASGHAGPMALFTVDVASGALQALGVSPAEYPDTARATDTVVYEIPRTRSALSMVAYADANATPRALATSTGSDAAPRVSPDGDRVVFVSDRSGQYQLWLYDLKAATALPLTDRADAGVTSPQWNAQGTRVVAVENDAQGRHLIEIDLASRRRRVLSRPEENVLLGVPGAADTYAWIAGTSGRDNRLLRVRHPGTPEETRDTLAEAVGIIEADPAKDVVYYEPTTGGRLFRADLDSGASQLVAGRLPDGAFAWRIVDGRLWYLSDIEEKSSKLHEFDPASGNDRVIGTLDAIMRNLDFSVMPDRKQILIVPFGTEDTDVGMFHLTRSEPSAR
ncbi:winged helix-turn-helix domain-containing protein [Dokdonella sp.]|uniref:winged helix-turn-helix domain-containing protein n=1 Tax=Dokdonella sp. TaxID=2291710 RepID=UPI003783E164